MMEGKATLSLEHISFSFGKTAAVHDVSLEVAAGSFTTLLGPSGCGKTTLLSLLGGLDSPTGGQILY
ncbi:MAG: ATP-binding cassette domain-containing protein, partial [Treponemataceae bacterium]|nr:ATP-binding cassette domain-containing protein [Treponemataceae bacterium]